MTSSAKPGKVASPPLARRLLLLRITREGMAGVLVSCGLAGVLISCGLAGDDSRVDCFWYGDTWVPFRDIWGSADTCQQQKASSDSHMDSQPSAVTAHEAQHGVQLAAA